MTPFVDFVGKPPSIGAVIRGKAPVTCVSFHEDGDHLFVASAEDARLRLVDCIKGTSDRAATRCETSGVRIVEATHDKYSVLIAGEGKEIPHTHAVTYLSVYDNAILRIFRGHLSKVTNISMSPTDDRFLSTSEDRTVRLWNLQQPGCIAMIPFLSDTGTSITCSPPNACFDSTGLVFAVTAAIPGGAGNLLHLYDARKYDSGPFSELKVDQSSVENFLTGKSMNMSNAKELSRMEWKSIAFNTTGSQMLATTNNMTGGGLALVLDGFTADVLQTFTLPKAAEDDTDSSSSSTSMTACFTQDDKYVLTGGCSNGTIQCWEASGTGNLITTLSGHNAGPVNAIACNPKRAMFASCCTNTALWI